MRERENNGIDFLWSSFLKGDDGSFSVIYQQHIEGLFLYGNKLCQDRELVRDCIQEVFIDLFLKRKKAGVNIGNLKSYLFVALRNCLVKKLTKGRKFESYVDEDDNEVPFRIEYSFQEQLIEYEISNEVKEKLNTGIKELAPRQKEIIYLKFEEGMDYPEIAGILKISVESARKLLYRALLKLRETVDPSAIRIVFFIFFKKKPDFMSIF